MGKFLSKKKSKELSAEAENLAKAYQTDAHKLSLDQISTNYNTDTISGLSKAGVESAIEKYGRNILTPPKRTPWWLLLIKNIFLGLFNILLWGGSLLCFISWGIEGRINNENLYLGVVLASVVTITGFFTFYQEARSNKIMDSFKNFLPQTVNVIREADFCEILATDLVPGDVLILKMGEKLPADVRIVKCSDDTQVNNSVLTGEAEPQDRSVKCTSEDPMETKNLAFFGTLLVRGQCKGIVINTGDQTLMGRIAQLTAKTGSVETPIRVEIGQFILKISGIAFTLGLVFGVVRGIDSRQAVPTIVFVIGIIVANVPEGLLATLTVSLTMAAKRMATKSVLIKHLECVETLGSTSVICSDKTGTLTMNRMTISHVFYEMTAFLCDTGNPILGKFDAENGSFKSLIRCAALCNSARYKTDGTISGDASETALVKFVNPHFDQKIEEFRSAHPIVHSIPFNSANKWQISIHKQNSNDSVFLLVLKGAPERILNYCDSYLENNETKPLTESARASISKGVISLGKKGERVLGFCQKELSSTQFPENSTFEGDSRENANFPFGRENEEGLVFLGLMSMIDPPRPGVPNAVAKCQSSGIMVIMVTGDHPITAKAIAKKVGIIKGDTIEDIIERKGCSINTIKDSDVKAVVVSGQKLAENVEDKTESEKCQFWNSILSKQNIVFARTSPQQKLLIVEACQERGGIVAVTGDGVNDSPALKKADIGIAMGITGTDVAKDAADMILLDDNFASIVCGIEEGRILFDNLKKSIAYTLSSNIPEISPFLFATVAKIPLPLRTVMILMIDIGTDLAPAISFAYEKKESDIMNRMPRDPKRDHLVTWILLSFSYLQIGMIQAFAGFFSYLVVFMDNKFAFWDLYNLDSNSRFESCAEEYKYLSCGKNGCSYKAEAFSDNDYRIFNMTCEQRIDILAQSNSAYFVAIVIVQWADLLICKTRLNSIIRQGMSSTFMVFSLFIESILAVLLLYVPFLNTAFRTRPIQFVYWCPAMMFSIVIFVYDELRKFWIRKHRNGLIDKMTYW